MSDMLETMNARLSRRTLLKVAAWLGLGTGLPGLGLAGQNSSSGRRNVGFVGHSLVSPAMAPLYAQISGDRATYQVINGAPLSYNWADHATAEGESIRDLLAAGAIDQLILAEGGPIEGSISGGSTRTFLQQWRSQGMAANPDLAVYWYQIWPEIPGWAGDPDWELWKREIARLAVEAYGPVCEQVASDIRTGRVYLSPVGEAFAQLHDTYLSPGLPGVSGFKATFFPIDGIHLPPIGFYFATMVHYATMNRQTPVGLPWRLNPPIHELNADLALALQEVAWDVASGHPYAGIAPWPEPPKGRATTGAPTRYSTSEGGGGSYGGDIDVGPARYGRIAVVFVDTVQPGYRPSSVTLGPDLALAEMATSVEHGYSGVWVAEVPDTATGTLELAVSSQTDRWANLATAYIVDGGDFATIAASSYRGDEPLRVAGGAGTCVIGSIFHMDGATSRLNAHPPLPEIEDSLGSTDGWHFRALWGTLVASANTRFEGSSHGHKVGLTIAPADR